MNILIISDTHGLIRPELAEYLKEADAIIHAGDIDRREIVNTLQSYAPLYVVRGNNDGSWAMDIPYEMRFTLDGIRFFAVHNSRDVPFNLSDTDVVVFGHSHKYYKDLEDGVLWLNPGSCGRRRFGGEVSFAIMETNHGQYKVEKIVLPNQVK